MINELFHQDSVNAILAIPLSRWSNSDILFWGRNKNGVYSVRSGYWLGMLGDYTSRQMNSSLVERKLWNRVWSLKGPPKIKHFLWRASKNTLPVNDVRFKRHMADSPLCSRCNVSSETICHALLDCQHSSWVWNTRMYANILTAAPRFSFGDCLTWIIEKCDHEALVVICASLWACWFGRNKLIMENKPSDFVHMSTSFVKMIHDYSIYTTEVTDFRAPAISIPRSWRLPDHG